MPKYQRAATLKVADINSNVQSFYDDLQNDFKKFFPILFKWSGIGYTEFNENEDIVVYTPEENRKQLLNSFSSTDIQKIDAFMSTLLSSQKAASSCYCVFYNQYVSSGAKLTKHRKEFIQNYVYSEEDRKAALKKDPQLSLISIERWLQIINDCNKNVEKVWEIVSSLIIDPNRATGCLVKHLLPTCNRPDDRNYTLILIEMLRRSLSSCKEKYEFHIEELESIKLQIEKNLENPDFSLLVELQRELFVKEYGRLSKAAWRYAVKEDNTYPNSNILKDLLSQEKYVALSSLDDLKRAILIKKLNQYISYLNRRPYPLIPKFNDRDYKVPFDNQGDFDLTIVGNRIQLDFGKALGKVSCYHSKYFSNLSITPKNYSFALKFNHFGKTQAISGVCKSIGLQIKDGNMYVTIYYAIDFEDENPTNLGYYFQYAVPPEGKFEALPDKARVMGVDLNIINPAPISMAEISKNGSGPIHARDYGYGSLIEAPKHLIIDSSRCYMIKKLSGVCHKVTSIIKEYKAAIKSETSLQEKSFSFLKSILLKNKQTKYYTYKTKLFLTNESIADMRKVRMFIQTHIAKINLKLGTLKNALRSSGYKNISEMIRLLELMDNYQSMVDSYDRFHLKSNEFLHRKPQTNMKRANFRLFACRRIASIIAQTAYRNKIQVVFIEDISMKFDRDSNTNSLTRLFAPRMIIDCIRLALEKFNICMVLVDPNGTSKTDPVTGDLAVRFKRELKCNMYVIRNGNVFVIDDDIAASLNVLLKGLNRHVPYKFYSFHPRVKHDYAEETTTNSKKLMARFFNDRFGKNIVRFWLDTDGNLTTEETNVPYNGEVYYRMNKFMTKIDHLKLQKMYEDRVMDMLGKNEEIERIDVSLCGERGYENFR